MMYKYCALLPWDILGVRMTIMRTPISFLFASEVVYFIAKVGFLVEEVVKGSVCLITQEEGKMILVFFFKLF